MATPLREIRVVRRADMDCELCQADLDHCHDVLVLHIDGTTDCADPRCEGQPQAHEWTVSCLDMNWSCICTRTGHTQPLAA